MVPRALSILQRIEGKVVLLATIIQALEMLGVKFGGSERQVKQGVSKFRLLALK